MGIAVLLLLCVALAGFGIGYALLKSGDGLYRGAGAGARVTVGMLTAGCVLLTLHELNAVEHPHGYAENYAGLFDFLLSLVAGAAALGLLIAFLLSLRSPPVISFPPVIRNDEPSTEVDAAPCAEAQKKKSTRLWPKQ